MPEATDKVPPQHAIELSASQAAKLFHLSPEDIEVLSQVRTVLLEASDTVLNRLFGRLSILPEGAGLFSGRRHAVQTKRMSRWLGRALRPWDPEVREPRLKALALHCARVGVPTTYVTAVFVCL